jgi:predicted small metal-binding protein
MLKMLSCRDIGLECDWQACAETEEGVLVQAVIHVKEAHGLAEISDAMLVKVRGAIKDGPCPASTCCCV